MSYTKNIGRFSTVALILLAMIGTFLFANIQKASAAPSSENTIKNYSDAKMLNRKYVSLKIEDQEYIFVDSNHFDSNFEFKLYNSDCDAKVTIDSPSKDQSDAKLDMDFGSSCSQTTPNELDIKIDTTNRDVWAEYREEGEIVFYEDGKTETENSATYLPANPSKSNSEGTLWVRDNNSSCTNLIIVSSDKVTFRFINLEDNKKNGEDGIDQLPSTELQDLVRDHFPDSCEIDSTNLVGVNTKVDGIYQMPEYRLANAQIVGVEGGPAGIDPNSNSNNAIEESCEDNDGQFVFFQCAALEFAGSTINKLDNSIQNALEVKSEYYNNPGIREAWGNIRDIAYIILIPMMLIMVISTALQFSFVDAYTVKRALPRMAIAIIFIALSYEFCVFLIELSHVVGRGLGGIIAAPFGGASNLTLTNIFSPSGVTAGALGVGVLGGVAVAFLGGVGLGVMASYLFIGALAMIIIFALLTMREMIIIFLVILSPLAILAWIFPGNDKFWKLWWQSFSKLLLLFPLIVGLLITGRVFALILAESGGPSEGFEAVTFTFAKFVAFIGPFFFIPKAFQMAGGAFATLAGMANDKGKGIFDRQKKYRADSRKAKRDRIASGNAFKRAGETGLKARINRAGEFAYASKDSDNFSFNARKWRRNIAQGINTHSGHEAQEFSQKDHDFAVIKNDDDMLWAARFTNEAEIRAELIRQGGARFTSDPAALDSAVSAIVRAQKKAGFETFNKARVEAQAATGTAYQTDDGLVDVVAMLNDINEAYGSDRAGAGAALARMRSAAVQSGQVALGKAGYATMATELGSLYNASDSKRAQAEIDARGRIYDDVLDSATAQEALYGKPSSAAVIGQAHARRIQRIATGITQGTHTQDDLDAATAAAAGLLDVMGTQSPQNAAAFANELMGVTIQGSGQMGGVGPLAPGQGAFGTQRPDLTVRDMIDDRMSNTEYRNRRRDWGSGAAANAAQQAQAGGAGGGGVGGNGAGGGGVGGIGGTP